MIQVSYTSDFEIEFFLQNQIVKKNFSFKKPHFLLFCSQESQTSRFRDFSKCTILMQIHSESKISKLYNFFLRLEANYWTWIQQLLCHAMTFFIGFLCLSGIFKQQFTNLGHLSGIAFIATNGQSKEKSAHQLCILSKK